MAKSLKDALLQAKLIRPEDTDEARREESWRARQAKDAAEVAAKMADPTPPPQWEAPPPGRIVERRPGSSVPESIACSECKRPFDPTSPEHKPFGRRDQCGPCAREEEAGPPRKRGQMVWTHKTAPTIEIEGGPTLTPEELAAMRRR